MTAISDASAIIITAIVVVGVLAVALFALNRRGRSVHVSIDVDDQNRAHSDKSGPARRDDPSETP